MEELKEKFFRLMGGFILCASSTVFMLNSNLGLSPWDVLHQGIEKHTFLTIGWASVIAGVICLIGGVILGQKLGIGTILNMIIVGPIIDFIIYIKIIPVTENITMGIVMMIIGMFTMGVGCYLYIGCGLGCGPRDGLMLALNEKLNIEIKYIRSIIEIIVLVLGYTLGGIVGLGTLISAIGLGYCLQLVFKIKKFDAKNIIHKSIFN